MKEPKEWLGFNFGLEESKTLNSTNDAIANLALHENDQTFCKLLINLANDTITLLFCQRGTIKLTRWISKQSVSV